MAGIDPLELALWGFNFALEAILAIVLLRRQRWRVYTGLFVYISVDFLQSVFLFLLYSSWGFTSIPAKRAAWLSQIPVLCMRAWAVGDLSRLLLRRYVGIWALAWRLLALLGSGLVVGSVLRAGRGWAQIVPNLNISLEWTTVVVLVALFIFARNYEVAASPTLRTMALGFLLYSSFAILNNTVLTHWLARYSDAWNILRTLSFLASVCLWLWAALRPVEETQQVSMLPRDVYQQLTPELNLRLRDLNERLGRLWNPEVHRP